MKIISILPDTWVRVWVQVKFLGLVGYVWADYGLRLVERANKLRQVSGQCVCQFSFLLVKLSGQTKDMKEYNLIALQQ